MRYFRVLPAAAGILALATTIGFTRNERESERNAPFRMSVVVRESAGNADSAASANLRPVAIDSETGEVYFATVTGGDDQSSRRLPDSRVKKV